MEYRCLVISDNFTSGDEFMQNLLGNSQNERQESLESEQHKRYYHNHHNHHRTLRNVVESREDDYFVQIHDKYNVASRKIMSRRKREQPKQIYSNANKTYAPSPVSLTLSHLAPSESLSEHLYKQRQEEEENRNTIKEEELEEEEDEENTAMLTSSTTNAVETLPTTIFKEHNALHIYTQRLTLPSPSMPSVNITLSLALLHEPHLLSRIIHPTYFAEDQRWRYHTYGSDAQISFHSPHALIFLFNPFHVPSLMSLRHVWINALSECRAIDEQIRVEEVQRKMAKSQHYGSSAFQPSKVNYNNGTRLIPTLSTAGSQSMSIESNSANANYSLLRHQRQHQRQQGKDKVGKLQWMKNSNMTFNGTNYIKCNASSTLPTILLIAHSFELLRESMESTPLISLPSPIELYKVNVQIGAVVYSELSYHWEDRIDQLKLHIARACVGEYKYYCAASLEEFYFTRQESISRGVAQLHQMDDMQSENESESDDTESAIALRQSEVNKQPCETEQEEEQHDKCLERELELGDKVHEERNVHSKDIRESDSNARTSKSTWTWRWHAQTGKVFYVHRPTATSTYERPADYDGKEPPINELRIVVNDVESKQLNKQKDVQQLTAERKTHKTHLPHTKKKNVKEKEQSTVEQLTEKVVDKEELNIIDESIIKELQEAVDMLESECAQVRADIGARELFVQQHNKLIELEQHNRYELIKHQTTELWESMMHLLREIEITKEHYRTLTPIIVVDNKEESETNNIVNVTLEEEKLHKHEIHNEEKNKMPSTCSSGNVTVKEVEELALNLHTLYLNSIKEIDIFTNKIKEIEFTSNECRDYDDDNKIVTSYWHELAILGKRQVSCEMAAMSMNAQLSQVEAEKVIEQDKLSTLFSQFM